MTPDLLEFTRRALEKGVAPDDVAGAIRAAGWSEQEATSALSAFGPVSFGLAPPKPKPHVSAREAFLYLLLFSTLYASIWNFVALIFIYIDRFAPDPTQTGLSSDSDIRWSVSMLIVIFPLFLFTFWLTHRAESGASAKSPSRVRSWLTYLTLYLSALTFAGCVVTLVYSLLSGEFTSHFLFKLLTIAIVASGIFVYFLNDVRRIDEE
jgi:hypothetical protein